MYFSHFKYSICLNSIRVSEETILYENFKRCKVTQITLLLFYINWVEETFQGVGTKIAKAMLSTKNYLVKLFHKKFGFHKMRLM